jgi:hypothetical protein
MNHYENTLFDVANDIISYRYSNIIDALVADDNYAVMNMMRRGKHINHEFQVLLLASRLGYNNVVTLLFIDCVLCFIGILVTLFIVCVFISCMVAVTIFIMVTHPTYIFSDDTRYQCLIERMTDLYCKIAMRCSRYA